MHIHTYILMHMYVSMSNDPSCIFHYAALCRLQQDIACTASATTPYAVVIDVVVVAFSAFSGLYAWYEWLAVSLRRNITHKCAAGYVYATLHLSTATSIAKNKKKIHNKIKANTMKSRLSVCALTSMLHALTAIMLTVLHTYVDCISYHIMHWLIILERITKIAGMCIVCIFIFYFLFLSHLSSAPQQLHLITALFT